MKKKTNEKLTDKKGVCHAGQRGVGGADHRDADLHLPLLGHQAVGLPWPWLLLLRHLRIHPARDDAHDGECFQAI